MYLQPSPKRYEEDADEYNYDEEYKEDENIYQISQEAEWRDFSDEAPGGVVKSRVGALSYDINAELDLTLIGDNDVLNEKLKKKFKSDKSLFADACYAFYKRYEGKTGKLDVTRFNNIIGKIPNIGFKNAKAMVLGYCLIDKKNIKVEYKGENRLEKLFEEIAENEHIKKADILRYAFLIKRYL
jgi:hypothetical protein